MHLLGEVGVTAAEDDHLLTFVCRRCHVRSGALVRAVGNAVTLHRVSLGSAQRDGRHTAQRLLALARCPNCGLRSELNILADVMRAALMGVIFAFLFAMCLIDERAPRLPFPPWAIGPFGGISYIVWHARRRIAQADKWVRFDWKR